MKYAWVDNDTLTIADINSGSRFPRLWNRRSGKETSIFAEKGEIYSHETPVHISPGRTHLLFHLDNGSKAVLWDISRANPTPKLLRHVQVNSAGAWISEQEWATLSSALPRPQVRITNVRTGKTRKMEINVPRDFVMMFGF